MDNYSATVGVLSTSEQIFELFRKHKRRGVDNNCANKHQCQKYFNLITHQLVQIQRTSGEQCNELNWVKKKKTELPISACAKPTKQGIDPCIVNFFFCATITAGLVCHYFSYLSFIKTRHAVFREINNYAIMIKSPSALAEVF